MIEPAAFLHQEEIGAILDAEMPSGDWVTLTELYDIVAAHATLTDADEEPEAPGSVSPRWKRNVRNYLQGHKDGGELEWDGDARYRYRQAEPAHAVARAAVADPVAPLPATEVWHLAPGDRIRRTELHDQYGGSRQGGTIPSRSTPNIFLFLDRAAAAEHGYYDGWVDDHLYYTGHGQHGDQEFRAGNAAVLRHREEGRAIRVFRGARGIVTYLGRFDLDPTQPYFLMEAAEADTGAPRQVIVFRLNPLGTAIHDLEDALELRQGHTPDSLEHAVTAATHEPVLTRVPVEEQHVEEVEVSRTTESYTAVRREQALVLAYKRHLEGSGSVVSRFRVQPAGDARAIICDIHDETRNNLVEAKGSGTRGEIRMAIGQLHDYRRFIDPTPALAVLVPRRPRKDLEELLAEASISAVWQTGDSFADNAGSRFC